MEHAQSFFDLARAAAPGATSHNRSSPPTKVAQLRDFSAAPSRPLKTRKSSKALGKQKALLVKIRGLS